MLEEIGRYCVRFWKDGNWERVVIDNLIPCDPLGNPLYAKGEDESQVWPYVMEKAYAKLHGKYELLKQDSIDYALTDLTGGKVERIPLKSQYEGIEKHELWEKLENMLIRGIIGCTHCSTMATEFETAKACRAGVVVGHTYSIVDLLEEGGERYVRIRSRPLSREWHEGRKEDACEARCSGVAPLTSVRLHTTAPASALEAISSSNSAASY